MSGIPHIGGISGYEAVRSATTPNQGLAVGDSSGGVGFADKVANAVESVDASQHAADDALSMLATGENVDLHGSMIALEEADIQLRAMVSVRDKALRAYETVMNMSV